MTHYPVAKKAKCWWHFQVMDVCEEAFCLASVETTLCGRLVSEGRLFLDTIFCLRWRRTLRMRCASLLMLCASCGRAGSGVRIRYRSRVRTDPPFGWVSRIQGGHYLRPRRQQIIRPKALVGRIIALTIFSRSGLGRKCPPGASSVGRAIWTQILKAV